MLVWARLIFWYPPPFLGVLSLLYVSIRLYTTYVRPHLEYAVATWNHYSKKDSDILEKVQRRASKVSHLMRKLSYEERLINLSLTTISARRERGDLIQQFKINHVNWVVPYARGAPKGDIRGNLRKTIITNCQQRTNFFTKRVINNWNVLPESVDDRLASPCASIDTHYSVKN